jgi:iron complex outermembrane receptor protein
MGSAVDLSFFGNNVTNKVFRVGHQDLHQDSSLGIASDIYGPPRMYGVILKYHFGAES